MNGIREECLRVRRGRTTTKGGTIRTWGQYRGIQSNSGEYIFFAQNTLRSARTHSRHVSITHQCYTPGCWVKKVLLGA